MYNYQTEKKNLFTDDGTRKYDAIRDKARHLLKEAGAFQMDNVISGQTGDSWLLLACVDRLVETGFIREIEQGAVPGQHRLFVSTNSRSN